MEHATVKADVRRQAAAARQCGRAAEDAAHRLLLEQGYVPVARNVRCRFGEIDLVARESGAVVFVEIKSRRGDRDGLKAGSAVDACKRGRLRGLAAWYLAHEGLDPETICRFDVVVVSLSGSGRPVAASVIQDAF
ncbi:MAG: YraN family protein [Bacillota bacterium]|nr:YraN family protein [Bacillota bacterium]